MLIFKCPGRHYLKGGGYDYKDVKEGDLQTLLAAGWHTTLADAIQARDGVKKPAVEAVEPEANEETQPTREELEIKAKELGLQYHHRTGDAKLLAMINEALK